MDIYIYIYIYILDYPGMYHDFLSSSTSAGPPYWDPAFGGTCLLDRSTTLRLAMENRKRTSTFLTGWWF